MPVYRDKKHPDCRIECYDSGNAVYIAPNGPCLKNCGEDGLAKTFGQILERHGYNTPFSAHLQIRLDDVDMLVSELRQRNDAPESVQRTTDLLDSLRQEIFALDSPLSPSLNRYSTYLTNTTVSAFLIHLSGIISGRLRRARNA